MVNSLQEGNSVPSLQERVPPDEVRFECIVQADQVVSLSDARQEFEHAADE